MDGGGAAVGPRQHTDPGDVLALAQGQTDDIRGRCEGHAGQLAHAPPDLVLEQDSAGAHEDQAARCLPQSMATEMEPRTAEHVAGRRAARRKLSRQPREQLFEHLLAASEQGMRVMGLRHAAPMLRMFRQSIAVEYGDLRVRIGEDSRGQQTGHTRPDHHRPASVVVRPHGLPPGWKVRPRGARLPDQSLPGAAHPVSGPRISRSHNHVTMRSTPWVRCRR